MHKCAVNQAALKYFFSPNLRESAYCAIV